MIWKFLFWPAVWTITFLPGWIWPLYLDGSMRIAAFFLEILTKISEIENIVKENKDILTIIVVQSTYTRKELGLCAKVE